MKVPGSKIVPCQGVLGSNHSLTFGLFTQVSGSGPLGPLVFQIEKCKKKMSFLDIFTISPSSAPERFLRMSPGFIMSGGVQVIRSTYVPNSTI